MGYEKLAPDVKQKLLALTVHAYEATEIDLDDDRIDKTIEFVVRDHYLRFNKNMNIWIDSVWLAKWIESNAVASQVVYKD